MSIADWFRRKPTQPDEPTEELPLGLYLTGIDPAIFMDWWEDEGAYDYGQYEKERTRPRAGFL